MSVKEGNNYKLMWSKMWPPKGRETILCPDTFRPQYDMEIALVTYMDAQHDGHLWSDESVAECEDEMIEEIMVELRSQIEGFVRKTDPFNAHRDFRKKIDE